jgi:peptidoglycan/LPS O-acetylase OafA/YrhL
VKVDSPASGYRADIDGLRAAAVAMVVAFHYFPKRAHGGFIGVDVFFVISGFLITSIIARDLNAGNFRFSDFYARRVRRIFPALAVVLAACLTIGAVSLDASEFKRLGLHVTAGAGFLSNVLLQSEAGYFDEEARDFKPLVNLWSLGVEEQFYILWPLSLYLCVRFRRPLWGFAIGVAGLSFALNLYLSRTDPVADFYFVLPRLWELALGALLALTIPNALHSRNVFANAAALVGGALIVGGLMALDGSQPFPGWRALAPTLGATLLIAAGPHTLVNGRLLSNRLMVGLGKISYPIYLWHWPLIAFARIREGGDVGPPVRWALIAVSIALSALTYMYVEKPIRFGFPHGRINRTAIAAAAVAALAFVGLIDFLRGGLFFPNAVVVAVANEGGVGPEEFTEYFRAHSAPCPAKLSVPNAEDHAFGSHCGVSRPGEAPQILILGDSHAYHLFPGLLEALSPRSVGYVIATSLPRLDHPVFAPVYDAIARDPAIETVILSAFWSAKARSLPAVASLREEIDRAVRFLLAAGKKVYIVTDVPDFPFHAARCKFAGRLGEPALCDQPEAQLERQLKSYLADLQAVAAANPGARLIDVAHALCANGVCSMALDGKLLYSDSNHLNLNGSRLIGAKIVAAAPDLGS